MSNRITERDLKGAIKTLNRITGNPEANYRREGDKTIANVGSYYLDMAYGGNKLVQIVNEGGGIREITYGFIPKRDLYHQIWAYIKGIEDGKGE